MVTLELVRVTLSLGDLPGLFARAFCALVPFC